MSGHYPQRRNRRGLGWLWLLAGLLLSSSAAALTIYDDGGTHTFNSSSADDFLVTNGSTLNVVAPADIQGSVTVGGGGAEAILNASGGAIRGGVQGTTDGGQFSTVNLSGDVVVEGSVNVAGTARVNISGNAVVTGSVHTHVFNSTMSGGQVNGGWGSDGSLLVMSGGEIRGRDDLTNGGDALRHIYGSLSISSGTLRGGYGGTRGGDAVETLEENVMISGGVFQGGDGGDYGGSALILGCCEQDISGGIFNAGHGGLEDGWLIGIGEGSPFRFSLDITGGVFGDESVGKGFGIFGTYNVYGFGLELADDFLTGTLSDGNPIAVPVVFVDTGPYTSLNLYEVPEPSTVVLLGTALAGLGWMSRRR